MSPAKMATWKRRSDGYPLHPVATRVGGPGPYQMGSTSTAVAPFASSYAAAPELQPETDRVALRDLVAFAKRSMWLLLTATVLGAGAAALLVWAELPTYRASSVIRLGEVADVVSVGLEAPRDQDRFVNRLLSEMELLRSRSLLGEVVDASGHRLQRDYAQFDPALLSSFFVSGDAQEDTLRLGFTATGYTMDLGGQAHLADYGEDATVSGVTLNIAARPRADTKEWPIVSRELAVDLLRDDLRVEARPETNIVDVSLEHPDPAAAQMIVNNLVTLYQGFEVRFAQERAQRRRVFLEEQLAQTDATLASSRRALSNLQSTNQLFDARQELSTQQQNRLGLEIRREELEADRRVLNDLLDRLNSAVEPERSTIIRTLVASPGVADNPVIRQIHDQLTQYQTTVDSLTTGEFADALANPSVRRLRQLVERTNDVLEQAIRTHVSAVGARSDALGELATRMASEIEMITPQLAEEGRLAQIVATYQKMSDQLREEYQKARMAEGVAVGRSDVVDLATLPYEPVPDLAPLKLALGALLGLVFGGGLAVVMEHRTRPVQDRDELESILQVPVLGGIPRAQSGSEEALKRRLQQLALEGEATDPPERRRLLPKREREAHVGEAYRMLATNLLFSHWTRDAKTLVVTSTSPKEGKTHTVTHLAVCVAEQGKRTLLVDADVWRGRVHETMGLPESPGMGDFLNGLRFRRRYIFETAVPGLHFIPRGDVLTNAAGLNRSGDLEGILSEVSSEYDVILIDAPPVLSAASAPALAAVADGVLFVVRAGKTDQKAVREALLELGIVGARVVGTVLNDVRRSNHKEAKRLSYYAYATD